MTSIVRRGGISLVVVSVLLIIIAVIGGIALYVYLTRTVRSAPPLPITVTASGSRYNDTFAAVTVTLVNGPLHALVISNVSIIGPGCSVVKTIPQLPIVVPPTAHRQSFVVLVRGECVAQGSAIIVVSYTDTNTKSRSVATAKVVFT